MYFDNDYPNLINAVYKTATGIDTSLIKLYKIQLNELTKLNKERKEINKNIKSIRSRNAMTYIEAVTLANELSSNDIETHALLQDRRMKWLYGCFCPSLRKGGQSKIIHL